MTWQRIVGAVVLSVLVPYGLFLGFSTLCAVCNGFVPTEGGRTK